MIGLVFLVAAVTYIAFLIWVTRVAYRWAKDKGFSKKKCLVIAVVGFLIIYFPMFWDHIPTLLAKQYLCATDGGFQVLKSVETWNAENPLKKQSVAPKGTYGSPTKDELFDDGREKRTTYFLNEHIVWIVIQKDVSTILPIIRIEQQVKDIANNDVLARYVDYSTGNYVKNTISPPGPLKFWLNTGTCRGGGKNQDSIREIRDEFAGRRV